MAKIKDKVPSPSQVKDKDTKDKVVKGKSNLVGRVKKVIKKSRRKLGEEKFEKELQRTIEFLGKLQTKLDATHSAGDNGKPPANNENKPPGASTKVEKKGARNAPKNSQPNKKNVKKPAGAGKKRKALLVEDATLAAEPAARQIEALSKGR